MTDCLSSGADLFSTTPTRTRAKEEAGNWEVGKEGRKEGRKAADSCCACSKDGRGREGKGGSGGGGEASVFVRRQVHTNGESLVRPYVRLSQRFPQVSGCSVKLEMGGVVYPITLYRVTVVDSTPEIERN